MSTAEEIMTSPLILTPRQRRNPVVFPKDATDEELARDWTLSKTDQAEVLRRRTNRHRLSFAIQRGHRGLPSCGRTAPLVEDHSAGAHDPRTDRRLSHVPQPPRRHRADRRSADAGCPGRDRYPRRGGGGRSSAGTLPVQAIPSRSQRRSHPHSSRQVESVAFPGRQSD
jgi:hypothetical protein